MEITIPGLKAEVGAGDLVKAALDKIGVKQGGCGCQQRQETLNRAIRFTPGTGSGARIGKWAQFTLEGRIVAGAIPPGMEFTGTSLQGIPNEPGRYEMTVERNSVRRVFTVIVEA